MDDLTPVSPSPVPSPDPGIGAAGTQTPPPPGGWAVASGRGATWWSEGWRLFMAAPLIWIVITLLFIALMFGLALIPFVGQIASSLLYPVLGAGVLIGTRELDRGGELKIGHLFACFNDKAVPLVVVALLYFGGWFVIWVLGAGLLVAIAGVETLTALMHGDAMESGMAFLGTFGVAALIVLLVMLLLSVPLIMAYWFAPALVVLRGDEPIAAMKSSFIACWRNMPPFLVYSLLGIVFAILATAVLGLGWIVLAPVYAATIYASYKDIYGPPTT